jgi:hypothetical protein
MSTISGPQLQHHRLFCSLILAANGPFQRELTERYTFFLQQFLSETACTFRAINVKISPLRRRALAPLSTMHGSSLQLRSLLLLLTAAIRATISVLIVPFENEFIGLLLQFPRLSPLIWPCSA